MFSEGGMNSPAAIISAAETVASGKLREVSSRQYWGVTSAAIESAPENNKKTNEVIFAANDLMMVLVMM